MEEKFSVPKNEAEFKERADKLTVEGVQSLLHSLVVKKHATLKPINDEIKFYVDVLKYKEDQGE